RGDKAARRGASREGATLPRPAREAPSLIQRGRASTVAAFVSRPGHASVSPLTRFTFHLSPVHPSCPTPRHHQPMHLPGDNAVVVFLAEDYAVVAKEDEPVPWDTDAADNLPVLGDGREVAHRVTLHDRLTEPCKTSRRNTDRGEVGDRV